MPPEPAFLIGLLLGALGLWLVQLYRRRSRRRSSRALNDGRLAADNARLSGEVEELHARLAVLEAIATDPAQRTARDIEALR